VRDNYRRNWTSREGLIWRRRKRGNENVNASGKFNEIGRGNAREKGRGSERGNERGTETEIGIGIGTGLEAVLTLPLPLAIRGLVIATSTRGSEIVRLIS
jgi:hypothetical protein